MSVSTASIFIGALHPFEPLPSSDALISVHEGDRVALTWHDLRGSARQATWLPYSPATIAETAIAMAAVYSGECDSPFAASEFVEITESDHEHVEALVATVAINLPGMAFQIVKGDGSVLDPRPFAELPNEVVLYEETWRSSES